MTPFPRTDYEALTRYTPDRRSVEVDLSDNTNLWGTHPAALARIRAAGTDDLARYPELYADRLRQAVAARFGVDVDCVTTGCGSDDVLDSAFRAAAGPGAAVSYADPTFSMIEPLARMNGMEPRPVPWPEALADAGRLLEGDPSLVYVCRPNNPTGEQAPQAWVDELLARVGPDGPLVIVDEAYADFAGETLIPRAPDHPRLLVARTSSKAYGLAGLRAGFAVASPAVALEIEKSRGPYKVTRLGADAAAAAVEDADGWMARTVAAAVASRERLTEELTRRGLPPLPSRSNFLLFRSLSGSAKDDALRLREHGVAVRPFTGIPGMGEGLRVTVGPWPLMERFLDALDAERDA
ncbi:MAG: aminotransferase class I/II-fold pyridoxal phosphate-dependent enzyme [Longimicrobiales bacterium]